LRTTQTQHQTSYKCTHTHTHKHTHTYTHIHAHIHAQTNTYIHRRTANPTWGDILECCFNAQSSKLERLFSLKRGKRDIRALSFELSEMTPQVGLAVLEDMRERNLVLPILTLIHIHTHTQPHMYTLSHTHKQTCSGKCERNKT